MEQHEIIEMAKQAGWSYMESGMDKQRLESFAKLVAAKEREACAKVCEAVGTDSMGYGCARLIRARGEA